LRRHAQNARGAVIDAAEDVAIKVRASCLTLATVVSKATVSKGGSLYHFPNEDDLLYATLDSVFYKDGEGGQDRRALLPKD
jgi:AcrR family transcriptional regulator